MGCCSNRSFGGVFILEHPCSTKVLIFFGKSGLFAIYELLKNSRRSKQGIPR